MKSNRATLFDRDQDHYLGDPDAEVSLVVYGDYTSEESLKAREILQKTAEGTEDKAVFVYRQMPEQYRKPESTWAAKAALAAAKQSRFWEMHKALYANGQKIDITMLGEIAAEIGLDVDQFMTDLESEGIDKELQQDCDDAAQAGVLVTPTLFINGRLYEGAWDEDSFREAVERPLGVKIRAVREDFFNWAASAGLILMVATICALLVSNLGGYGLYESVRNTEFGLQLGERAFSMSINHWINDGLMAVFFLLIGIEIKREIVDGELSEISTAALPLAGAAGGMLIPALIYFAFNVNGGSLQGWGVPMATDIAFTLGLMALLGKRVPVSLTIFISALAVADDLGAILVIAVFYGHGISIGPLLGAFAVLVFMFLLNRARVYSRIPYVFLGMMLWFLVYQSGLHATLAGVLTAVLIPSRRRANVAGVAAQASAIFEAELKAVDSNEGMQEAKVRPGSLSMLHNAMDRLREPGYHLERAMEHWSNFLILPLFAFFNTGILLTSSSIQLTTPESMGVIVGLVIGKPLGIVCVCLLAVKLNVARLPDDVSWQQVLGAACLAGVGFTMSIFISGEAFVGVQLEAIKFSVLLASVIAGSLGMLILYRAARST